MREMDRRTEVGSAVAAFGAAVYVAVLVALPFVDPTFNVVTAHPEDYAAGRLGWAVNVSYLALAIALVCFVISALPVRRWAIAVPALVMPPTILCVALAVDPVGVAAGTQLLLLPIVCLAMVPLIASMTLRDRLGTWHRLLAGLAVVVLLAFAALIVAPDTVGGAVNRAFDVALGLWFVLAAIAVRRGAAWASVRAAPLTET